MSETTPRLNLPLIGDHSQKHIVMNAGLMRLESLVQAQALSRSVTAQPASPADGDSYIVPAGAAWSGLSAGTYVRAESGTWEAVDFPNGAIVHIADENRFLIKTSTGWAAFEGALKTLDNLDHLGVGTTADSYNVLALKGPAALLSAQSVASGGSGDISLSLNKDADGNSAQILWQKGYSLRAILGLLGDNSLTLKVSGDGTTWTTALTVTPAGQVSAKWGTQPPLWPMKNLLGTGGQRIGPLGAGVTGTTTVTANRLYMLPVIIPYDTPLTAIGLRLTTGVSGHMRLGLYRDAQGHPGALVCDSGALSTATAGPVEATVSQSLTAGVYWLAAVFDAAPLVTSHTSTGLGRDATTAAPVSGYYRSFAYAALTTDESAQAYTATTADMPTVMLG